VAVFVREFTGATHSLQQEFLRTTLQAFQLQILTIDTVYRRVMNFCLSSNSTCGSVTLRYTFLTQNHLIDRINVISARTARSPAPLTPYRTANVSQVCLQLIRIRNRPTFLRKCSNKFCRHNS